MPTVTAIIPARLASERFPRKVLASDTGLPLVVHVLRAARRAAAVHRALVATDSEEVARAVRGAGGEAVLTRPDHPNGTARLAEAAELLGLPDDDVVVNAQGDEPELPPDTIDAAVAALTDAEPAAGDSPVPPPSIGTAAAPLADPAEIADPNVVKVVRDARGRALYFSRAPIPHHRDPLPPRRDPLPPRRDPADRPHPASPAPDAAAPLRHIGLYTYTAGFLRRYAALPPTPLERTEKLEQLRALEHGCAIAVALVPAAHPGVDTPEQYAAFVRRHAAAHATNAPDPPDPAQPPKPAM